MEYMVDELQIFSDNFSSLLQIGVLDAFLRFGSVEIARVNSTVAQPYCGS